MDIAARTRFARAAWAVLAWNVLVVLWGAYVRATGSGAGCGGHWPLCNGDVLPRSPQTATIIEFTHRVTSGVALVGVFALAFFARRVFPKGERARTAAAVSALLIVTEALLGAGLVIFDYVAHNASAGRAIYLSLHLANTQLLLAALTITAWSATRATAGASRLVLSALVIAVAVSITGAIAALGDTLFPASSLASGIRQDFSTTASVLVRIRVIHPVLAVAAAAFFLWVGMRQRSILVILLTLAQVCAGAINIALLAPVWMQIVHLLLADLLWIALVVLALQSSTDRTAVEGVLRSQAA